MGPRSVSPVYQDPQIMTHLRPAANFDFSDHRGESRNSDTSSIPEGLARSPTDHSEAAPRMLPDRLESLIESRKRQTVDLSEKRKRRREDTSARANRVEDSFFDLQPAMTERAGHRECLPNLVSQRLPAPSIFKSKPTFRPQPPEEEELEEDSRPTEKVRSPVEHSLDFFFVISTSKFPDYRRFQNDVADLEESFFKNFQPPSWPPKFPKKSELSNTDWVNRTDLHVLQMLLSEICLRNKAFLWVFTPPGARNLRLTEQDKFCQWLKQQMVDWANSDLESPERLPTQHFLSTHFEGINAKGKELPPGWDSDLLLSHSTHKTMTEILGMQTKCALHILAEYYKSKNFEKWVDLFMGQEGFVQFFAHLKQTEHNHQFRSYADRKKDVESLDIFPWEDERRYPLEKFARPKRGDTIHAIRSMRSDQFMKRVAPQL